MGTFHVSIWILTLLKLSQASVVPTTYRPSVSIDTSQTRDYGSQKYVQNLNQYQFFRKNPFLANHTQPTNATYRLWGKTYVGHGLNVNSSSVNISKISEMYASKEHPDSRLKSENSDNGIDLNASAVNIPKWSERHANQASLEGISKFDDVNYKVNLNDSSVNISDWSEIYESQDRLEGHVEGDDDVPVYQKKGGQLITLEEISNTTQLVIRARGVTTALWETVSIIYGCVKNFWGRGLVQCLTARTASMLEGILGDRTDLRHPTVPEDEEEGPRDSSEQEQGRKKMLKKMMLPFTIALKIKFFLILMGVAVLAGKALLISTASFLMSLVLYVKKAAGEGGHGTEHHTVYPSYHKRVDDMGGAMVSLNGGRGLYM